MPEVPLEHAEEEIQHHAHAATEKWIMGVALTAAILAALAAVTALLGEYHAHHALLTQIRASDQWAYYQAKGIKAGQLNAKVDLLRAMGKTVSEKDLATVDRYAEEQKEIKHEAESLEAESRAHLAHHLPLSAGVTMFQIAIAIGAISVLTKRKQFWLVCLAFGLIGVVFLVWGLLPVTPEAVH